MYDALAELIFQSERSDTRFENACIALVGKHEGVTFFATSQSWDLGRDARSIGRAKGSHPNILCATLNEQLDAKAEADLLRLTALASPDRIVYCSSQKLSELRVDQITASLRRHSPQGSIDVLGAKQLAGIAAQNRQSFEKYYGAELSDIRSMVLTEQPSGAPTAGFRLALLTFGSPEGSELRDEVLRSTLLDKLSPTEGHTVDELVGAFSADIGLPRHLPSSFLSNALEQAENAGLVERDANRWRLTPNGASKKKDLPIHGAEQLLAGRSIIRESLEVLIGKHFSNQQFNLIWSALIDVLAAMFHANGLEVVQGIDEVMKAEGAAGQPPLNFKRELEAGMRRVVSNIKTDDLRNQTYRALLDLFTERQGPAFEWLTEVSGRFVTLCALGLEKESGEALRETLTSQRVVPDSDILLDYLCKAEPDHEASRDLLVNWLNISGKILASPIILEEVAHNAWISDRDFRETESLLGKLRPWELSRYIKNPFVRTFHFFGAPANKWQLFIGQFRGNAPGDYSKILTILRQRLKVELLPAVFDQKLSAEISSYLRRWPIASQSDGEHLEDVLFKVDRDGKLLASVAAARAAAEASGFESPMVILSSSGALRAAELKFKDFLGEARLVLNKRSFSYLLASVPQVSLGADTLRRALFTFGSHGRLKSDGVKALRLIRATGDFDIPWAERFTLRQELLRSIKVEADRRGMSKKDLNAAFVAGTAGDSAVTVIVDAIRNLALPANVSLELTAAQKQIRELEAKLAQAEATTRQLTAARRADSPITQAPTKIR